MKILFELFLKSFLVIAIVSFATFALVGIANAASIHSCSPQANKCIIKLESGNIGDRVEVTDQKARPIAQAYIVKKKGNYAVIKIKNKEKEIKVGYPVLLRRHSKSNDAQWAATFSFQG